MKLKRTFCGVCAFVIFASVFVMFDFSESRIAIASSVGAQVPRQPDFSLISGPGPMGSINLAVANTIDVRNISETFVKLYFSNNNAHTVTIEQADACKTGANVDVTGGLANNTKANDFSVFTTTTNENFLSPRSSGLIDTYRAEVVQNCGGSINLRIPAGSLRLSSETGYYVAYFVADDPTRGINNTFRVQLNPGDGGVYAGLAADKAFGLDEGGSRGGYTRYEIGFGACDIPPGGELARITWYDIDNGNSGIQPNPARFRLRNDNTGNFVNFSAVNDGQIIGSNQVEPRNGNGVKGWAEFTALQNNKYSLIWSGSGIYSTNTLELELPYDQVFHEINCPVQVTNTDGRYTITTAALEHEKGSGDKTIGATFAVNTRPCSSSLAVGSPVNVVWTITGPGIAAPTAATSATVNIPNCSGAITGETILTRQVNGATLDGLPTPTTVGPVGPYQGTITSYGTVPGAVTGLPVNITVVTFPYVRFYGNDVSAAGCGTSTSPPLGTPADTSDLYGGIVANRRSADIALPTKQETPPPDGSTTAYPLGNKFGGAASEYAAIAMNNKENTVLTGVFQPDNSSSPIKLQAYWPGNASCPDVQFADAKAATVDLTETDSPANGDTYTILASAPGATSFVKGAGNLTLNAAATVAGKQTIYANGDVIINQNILTNITTGTFDANTAPYILIIAEGNIYIKPGVSIVNAMLVAKGDIFTCSDATGTGGQPQGDIELNCGTKLTINGGLLANYIHFQRSGGTRLFAPNSERSNAAAGLGSAAESINFPYYMYFTSPYLTDQAGTSFQSYFSPAPYF